MSGSITTKRFGAAVRSLRYQLGLSQEKLAARAQLHRTYIAGIEGGSRNVTLNSIVRLAKALEVSTADLLATDESDGTGPRSPSQGKIVDILLVEDEENDIELTLEAFQTAHIVNSVHVARDGQEALDFLFGEGEYANRAAARPPRLILLDLNLPRVDGMTVLRRVKSDPRTRAIPVIVLTISRNSADFAESKALGAETYIVKPVDFQSFSQATPQLKMQWALLEAAVPAVNLVN